MTIDQSYLIQQYCHLGKTKKSTMFQQILVVPRSLARYLSLRIPLKVSILNLISNSKADLHLLPLDEDFSALKVISEDKKTLMGKNPMKLDIAPRLLKLLHDSDKCCYLVFVGKYKFRCHLAVLQAHSKYFLHKASPDELVSHLPMKHITPPAFHLIYNWMLGVKNAKATNDSPCRSIVETISAVKFLRVDELHEQCWSLLNAPEITENVAFALCQEAVRFDIPKFSTTMLARICKFFLTLVASREFLELDGDIVCQLLAMHNVGVNSEIEVFMSALRWLAHTWPERRPHMVKLMHCVRFGLLPPLFLRFLQNEQQTKVLQCISQNSEVQEMINKAFVYASIELFGCDLKKRLPYLLPDCELPEQRKWIYDKECSYHQESNSTHRQFFTYTEFLNYLKSLQEKGPNHWQQLAVLRDIRGSV
ncbi:kelch-like protein 35 isoform X2 [Drosophila tropicalis]|uniref:kelch-like protein 35 isoform X2 n=1 Tax=Drosophila tropicalis TaxID=46794 RepID=UPI0035ABC3DD